MRIREKLYQISELTGSNFKQETYRLLRIYRATPHCTTKFATADFTYFDCKFHTTLPIGVTSREHDFDELYQRDVEKKMQMKSYADNKRYVKTSEHQIEDSVGKKAFNKASPPHETKPLQVKSRKGTRMVAKRPEGSTITRSTAHFNKVPFSSLVKRNNGAPPNGQQDLSVSQHGALRKMGALARGRVKRLPLGGRGSGFAHTGAPAGKLAITTSG